MFYRFIYANEVNKWTIEKTNAIEWNCIKTLEPTVLPPVGVKCMCSVQLCTHLNSLSCALQFLKFRFRHLSDEPCRMGNNTGIYEITVDSVKCIHRIWKEFRAKLWNHTNWMQLERWTPLYGHSTQQPESNRQIHAQFYLHESKASTHSTLSAVTFICTTTNAVMIPMRWLANLQQARNLASTRGSSN